MRMSHFPLLRAHNAGGVIATMHRPDDREGFPRVNAFWRHALAAP